LQSIGEPFRPTATKAEVVEQYISEVITGQHASEALFDTAVLAAGVGVHGTVGAGHGCGHAGIRRVGLGIVGLGLVG
jgi:hypothetical protein